MCIFVIILAFVIGSAGCDITAIGKEYPLDKSDRWYCDELDLEWYFRYDEEGKLIQDKYELTWEDTVYEVNISFNISSIIVCSAENKPYGIAGETLLEGGYYYQDGNLIFKIVQDNLLNGAYTELVFVPVP